MINNIPQPEEFEDVGYECLIQAYKNICQIDNEELSEGVDRDEIWEYHKIVLKTSVILLHQGIEAMLKFKVAMISPLLLIDQKRGDWKTLPNSDDCDFSDLYTISGNDLVRTFYATVSPSDYPEGLVGHFEEIRLLRNKMIHGAGGDILSPEYILKLILTTFTLLCGQGSFWVALQDKFYSHPALLEGRPVLVFDEDEQYIHLQYLEALLGTAELNRHFVEDLKARRYYCPDCGSPKGVSVSSEGEVSNFPDFKYAFLHPNTPESTGVYCLMCKYLFEVERTDCNKEGCKGNVIYTEEDEDRDDQSGEVYQEAVKVCLTCNDIQ